MKDYPILKGCGTELFTPFKADGSVDYDTFAANIDRQIEAGIHFLVPLGTTGETPALSTEERIEILKIAKAHSKGRPVVVGGGTNNVPETLAAMQALEPYGPDVFLIVVPYYNKPPQEGIYQYFKAVAASTRKPILIYNVPGRTGSNIEAATALRLAKDIPNIMLEVAVTTGQVVLMIATASALGWVFAHESVPAIISSFVLGATRNKFLILLLINLLLLFVGTWMDLSPAVTVFCPILMPIVLALGIDPVHFGVIMVINLAIGLFTPPVGVCLFLACGIGKISITQSIKAFIPYFFSMLLVLLLITYWPQLVMLLPNMMG